MDIETYSVGLGQIASMYSVAGEVQNTFAEKSHKAGDFGIEACSVMKFREGLWLEWWALSVRCLTPCQWTEDLYLGRLFLGLPIGSFHPNFPYYPLH